MRPCPAPPLWTVAPGFRPDLRCRGDVLGLSGLSLLAQVASPDTALLATARGVFGAALLVALAMAMTAIHDRDILRHRAWVIRGYAIGMGSGTVALVFSSIYIINGEPPNGLVAVLIFVCWWAINIGLAEWLIHRLFPSSYRIPV